LEWGRKRRPPTPISSEKIGEMGRTPISPIFSGAFEIWAAASPGPRQKAIPALKVGHMPEDGDYLRKLEWGRNRHRPHPRLIQEKMRARNDAWLSFFLGSVQDDGACFGRQGWEMIGAGTQSGVCKKATFTSKADGAEGMPVTQQNSDLGKLIILRFPFTTRLLSVSGLSAVLSQIVLIQ
jgi:hypothetical protein